MESKRSNAQDAWGKMIHYHGTPVGGSRAQAAEFLITKHALVPFFHPKDLPIVAEVCQSFCLDNSAYSIWRQGGTLDVDGYIEWVEKWHLHPRFDFAFIPDSIEGDADDNDRLLKSWPSHLNGVPVWHPHEPIDRLKRLCDSWRRVAIGGSPVYNQIGSANWWNRIGMAMDSICDKEGRPPCKLHGLRMLDPAIFTKLPLSSGDSVNAARNNGNKNGWGYYRPPTAAQRATVIAARIEAHTSASTWERIDQMEFALT